MTASKEFLTARTAGRGMVAMAMAMAMAATVLAAGCAHTTATTPANGSAVRQDDAAPGGQGDPSAGDGARLPEATTHSTIQAIAKDTADGSGGAAAAAAGWDGTVLHPARPVTVHSTPGGTAVARLPAEQLGGPTWVPVVEESSGWYRVLLPSRPNGATGWIPARPSGAGGSGEAVGGGDSSDSSDSGAVETAHSPYLVTVDLSERRLVLLKSGRRVGAWSVAVGAPATPTPTGRTFVLASLAPPDRQPSPLVLPLGTHSETLEDFGGGPGTVAFHGWADTSVFGSAVTHGCVRVPEAALRALSQVPLGTVVLIGR